MKNIWACHLLLDETKKQALTILRRECGKNYKARKRNFYLKWQERSLLKLWFRQYHSILWVISSYPWVYALISSVLFESFGGGNEVINWKFIGWNRKIFVSLILRVVWGLRIRHFFNNALLAKQAWWLLHNKISLFYRVSRQDFSLIVQSWRPLIPWLGPMLGKVSWRVGMFFARVHIGESVMICDNALKCIFIIYLCGCYFRITILNLYY